MNIELNHISEYNRNAPGSTPCYILELPYIMLAFSYSTIVGFKRYGRPWYLVENDYSHTTGHHLNLLEDMTITREERLDQETFKIELQEAMQHVLNQ